MSELRTVIDVWSHPGFQTGLLAGLMGLALVVAIPLMVRRRAHGWGIVFAISAVVALTIRSEVETDILIRLGILAVAGLLVDLTSSLNWLWAWLLTSIGWAGAAIAALLLGAELGISEPPWLVFAFPLTVVGLAAGLWAWGRLPQAGLVGPLMGIGVAGAWVTIPETDLFVVLLGAAIPLGLVTLWPSSARPSAAGALALAGVFAWLVIQGGMPRPWTVAASWAAVATIPFIAALINRGFGHPGRIAIVVIDLVYAAVVTRVADYTDSVIAVVGWSAAALVAVGLAVAFLPERPLVVSESGSL